MPRDGTGSFGINEGARPRPSMNATAEYAKPAAAPRMNISRPDMPTRPPLGTGVPLPPRLAAPVGIAAKAPPPGPMVNGVDPRAAMQQRMAMAASRVPGLAPYRGDMTKAPLMTGAYPALTKPIIG